MPDVMAGAKFERFFREAAGLDVDKSDRKRYLEFIQQKIEDLVVRAEAIAKANGRDIIQPHDLPITKGLQECLYEYRRIDKGLNIGPILDKLTPWPPTDLAYSVETEAYFPVVAGALSVALARSFKIIDPHLKNPESEHWERSFEVFGLLL
ncbi:MAG TPA: DUF1931 family protein [Alphaproteobacteria bacterium]